MAYEEFILFLKEWKILNEIGSILKTTRESSGVTIEEASTDLDIKGVVLENIEDGKIGCFKDVFELKEYIHNYAKYLGLDGDKLIDEFNEYLFEYTSRIPVKEIEKAVNEKAKEEPKVLSPYTKEIRKHGKYFYLFIYIGIVLLVILAIFWSVKQITVDKKVANVISFVE